MTRFVSVKDAYCLWQQLFWTQCSMALATVGFALLGFLWAALIPLGVWIYLERSRRRYRELFWSQALALHSAQDEGEPEIYQFMRRKHQREHASRATASWLPSEEEE